MRFLLSLLLILWPQLPQGGITAAGAALTPVAWKNTGVPASLAATTFTQAFAVTAGGNKKCAFAAVGLVGTGAAITTVTYGGNAMTAIGTPAPTASGSFNLQWFYLVNPPTGANNLVATANGSTTRIYLNLVSFTEVNQTTPARPGTFISSNGSGTSASQSITSNTNDLTLGIVGSGSGVSSTNQTSDGITNGGSIGFGADHATTAASSITDTWTLSSGVWALAGFSIQP